MRNNNSPRRSSLLLVGMLILGGWLGNFLASLAARVLPVLGHALPLGWSTPWAVSLDFISFSIALMIKITPIGLLCMIGAVLIWRKI